MSDEVSARVHALIAQWRETAWEETEAVKFLQPDTLQVALLEHSADTYGICANDLEAALAAAPQEPCVCHVEDGLVQEWVAKAREVAKGKGYLAAARACDQCGWRPSPTWKSERCGALPFGSCDGTVRAALAAALAPPISADDQVDFFVGRLELLLYRRTGNTWEMNQLRAVRALFRDVLAAAALAPNSEKEK